MSSSAKTTRMNYPDLDLAKLVMALLVVEAHTRPLQGLSCDLLLRSISVTPFFFIASGFLCFRGIDFDAFASSDSRGSLRVRKTIGKLLKLYLTWTVLYLPVTIFGDILLGVSPLSGFKYFVRGALFVGENFCSWPLWYLLASAIAFALVYICLRGGVSQRQLLLISTGLLFAGYFLTVIRTLDNLPFFIAFPVNTYFSVFLNTRNGLFEGFFYVAVGAVLGTKHARLGELPAVGLCAGVALGFLGCMLVSKDDHLPFSACASICFFLLTVRRCGADFPQHVAARNASTIIYLVHMYFVVIFVYGICGGINPTVLANDISGPLLYLFALGGSILVAVVVIALSKRVAAIKTVFGV